jgi:hypothetical protein
VSAVASLEDRRAVRALQLGTFGRLRADLAPKPAKRKAPKRLPRASKAIAWGKPHPALGEGVCASMARMSAGMPATYRHRYAFRDVCVIVGVVIMLSVVFAAGVATSHRGGSDERSNVQNVHL